MNTEDFDQSPIGRLVPLQGHDPRLQREFNHWAYVPNDLSENIALTNQTHSAVADAAREIGRLQSAIDQFPNPGILLHTSLKREAQSTSALEGTYAPLESIFEGEYLNKSEINSELREILNYIEAANLGLNEIKGKPIHINMLSELQGLIVKGTQGGQSRAGQIRNSPVIIGERSSPVESARFIPPPDGKWLNEGYQNWETWINTDHAMSKIIKIALSHYQFETLHPYNDGNGRLGRLIISLQFVTFGLLNPPVLNLSAYLNEFKEEYKDQLLNLSKDGNFDRWIEFFAVAITKQAQNELARIKSLIDYRETMFVEIKKSGGRGIITEVPDFVLERPLFSIQELANKFAVTYPAANTAILKLVDLGFLAEITNRKSRKLFLAPQILNILNNSGR